jgi:hypothetical protein
MEHNRESVSFSENPKIEENILMLAAVGCLHCMDVGSSFEYAWHLHIQSQRM